MNPEVESAPLPSELWIEDLAAADTGVPWLWEGYLAAGQVTLLTSQWKAGKTTLLSVLLARLEQAGSLAGLPVAPSRAAVISEESPSHWQARAGRLRLGRHICFQCRPFKGKPTFSEWTRLIDRQAELHRQHGINLLVIDTLNTFLPGRGENSSALMTEALMPLQRLTALGMALLLLHHPRKGECQAGQAARGSGALPSFADICIEMKPFGRHGLDDRRRRLHGYSRFAQTPTQLVIELNEAGTDYQNLGSLVQADFADNWTLLHAVLDSAPRKLTRQGILAAWPEDHLPPNGATLWRWLSRALADQLIRREGSGTRSDPYQFWLPAREEVWNQDPMQEWLENLNRLAREQDPKDDWLENLNRQAREHDREEAAAENDLENLDG